MRFQQELHSSNVSSFKKAVFKASNLNPIEFNQKMAKFEKRKKQMESGSHGFSLFQVYFHKHKHSAYLTIFTSKCFSI